MTTSQARAGNGHLIKGGDFRKLIWKREDARIEEMRGSEEEDGKICEKNV